MAFADELTPLIHAHAHNDYEHTHPLLDALDQGFCSVEADVWLVKGQLLVAHSAYQVNSNRTLQSLYLDPLRERIKRNGGHVFTNGPEFSLMIDIKSSWTNTYPVLRKVLAEYADVLTTFRKGIKQPGAITVVFSGDHAIRMFDGEEVRYAASDGTLVDLDSKAPADLIPWISGDWKRDFNWRGVGAIPDVDANKLRSIVNRAHEQGRKVRFWGAPDTPNFWQAMLAAGVDLINTDDLAGLRKFFEEGRTNSIPAKPESAR